LLSGEDQPIEIREICWFDGNIDLIAKVLEALRLGLRGVLEGIWVGVDKGGGFVEAVFGDKCRGRIDEKGEEEDWE